MNMNEYNPYTYSPMLRAFFVNSSFPQAKPVPPQVVAAAAEMPQAAQHVYSVWNFLSWLQDANPALYNVIANTPLADPVAVVASGQLSPGGKPVQQTAGKGMAGLGDVYEDAALAEAAANGGMVPTVPSASGTPDIYTQWGAKVFDLAGKYLQYDSQKQIVALNIKRAEQGLAPIDSGLLAPTVNVGVSKNVQTLAYVAVGGLVVAGLVGAFAKSRGK